MKKKVLSALAVVTAMATMAASTAMFASAAELPDGAVDFSNTRYRYKIVDFDNALFDPTGTVDDAWKAAEKANKKYLGTDIPDYDGRDKLFEAKYSQLPELGSEYYGIKVRMYNEQVWDTEKQQFPFKEQYACTRLIPGFNTAVNPLFGKPNIASGDNANGIMLFVKQSGLNGEGNFVRNQVEGTTGEVYHVDDAYQYNVNITLHEKAFNEDGTPMMIENPEYDPEDPEFMEEMNIAPTIQANTAHNLGNNTPITFVWTKDIDFSYFTYVLDDQGNKVIENDVPKTEIHEVSKKCGDTEVVMSTDGAVTFPRGFEGYMVVPFSSMQYNNWPNTEDTAIALKNVISASLYTGFYGQDKGEFTIGDYNFFGPAFASVDKAYDMGADVTAASRGFGSDISGEPIPDPDPSPDPSTSTDNSTTDDESTPNANTGAAGIAGAVAVLALAGTASVVAFKKRK